MVDAGHAELASLLLAAGADQNAVSKSGSTPLMLARQHGNRLVERVLVAHVTAR